MALVFSTDTFFVCFCTDLNAKMSKTPVFTLFELSNNVNEKALKHKIDFNAYGWRGHDDFNMA